MSDICLYIPLEDYLADWFVNEQGGNRPVRLMRGSIESALLEQFLQTPPQDLYVAIASPLFISVPTSGQSHICFYGKAQHCHVGEELERHR